MMHEHAQTWSVLKTLYSSPGETRTTGSTLGPSTKTALAAGSHGSGGALSTTGNPEPAAGNGINLIELDVFLTLAFAFNFRAFHKLYCIFSPLFPEAGRG